LLLVRGSRLRVFTIFAALFVAGLYAQRLAGARLQSDGFYYFAYLRSIVFDRDVNFLNDYELIGLGDKRHLFTLTPTGHAQSAWTIGPAIVWSPFFGAAHLVALPLSKTRPNVAADGTSYPYRQSVCIAGLFYGLLGGYFTWRLCRLFSASRIAVAATGLAIGGSFMLWYIVCEPSMTHAPAMASIAGFAWLWAATLWRRTTWQWMALGVLGGLMADIRWQSAIYGLLPLFEAGALAWRAGRIRDVSALRRLAGNAAVGSAAFLVGFLPQLLAWKAIYGTYVAVSPIGPEIRFNDPHWADVLWSSRNGLFSTSPILIVGALGFAILARRHRVVGLAFALSCALMVLFNSMIQDWWSSAAFGGRRFDGAVPLLAVGVAMAIDVGRRLVASRPFMPAAVLLAAAVIWNASLASAVRGGAFETTTQNDFGTVAGAQWRGLHARFGYPFSMPANLWFAWRNRTSPAAYDLLAPNRFFNDPVTAVGQIDFGGARDAVFAGNGLFPAAVDGSVSYRPAGRVAEILFPIGRTAPFKLMVRLRAREIDGAPPQRVAVAVNGAGCGDFTLGSAWQTFACEVPAGLMHVTVNRVVLTAARGSNGEPAFDLDLLRVDRLDRQ
ncbi:MAG TPA: hypothetical protein VFV98_06175, partial [Vicinamibacterales bacterium]|nr:hypothetical protein [Vicinamibacterales bacterium]